jgi:hypothetical protein
VSALRAQFGGHAIEGAAGSPGDAGGGTAPGSAADAYPTG